MIKIYHQSHNQILPINQLEKNCWIQMIDPTDEEITKISEENHIDKEMIQAALDLEESARIEIYEISAMFVSKLNTLNKQRMKIENDAQFALNDRHLYQLLEIEKSLIYFLTSLKSNSVVLEKISRISSLSFDTTSHDLLEDVIIETRQAIETSQLYKSILDSISNSYSSLISNRMNNIMKILTNITIILTLPTLVFSFYGMNVDLPFDQSPASWLIIILISLVLIFLFSWALWKNKFL